MPELSMMRRLEADLGPPPAPIYPPLLETPEQQAMYLKAMAEAGQRVAQEAKQDKEIPWRTIGLFAGGGVALVLCVVWFANMKDEALKNLGWGLLALAVLCFAVAALPTQGHEGPATA